MKKHIGYLGFICIVLFVVMTFADKEENENIKQAKAQENLKLSKGVEAKLEEKIVSRKASKFDYHKKPAETVISNKLVKEIGVNHFFYSETINSTVWKRIYKKSYKEDCTIQKKELRYIRILYYGFDKKNHIGELIVNRKIAKETIAIFRELYQKKYPIQRVVLIDNYHANDEKSMTANNTSCFNYRKINGQKTLSNHSKGLAIDINPLYNPCVRYQNGAAVIEPKAGKLYANRNKNFAYKIDKKDTCYKIFTKYGFRWGGNWNSLKDYQHFEKTDL